MATLSATFTPSGEIAKRFYGEGSGRSSNAPSFPSSQAPPLLDFCYGAEIPVGLPDATNRSAIWRALRAAPLRSWSPEAKRQIAFGFDTS